MADVAPVLPWIKPGWVGVEIGVAQGHSALALLEHGVNFLYLVDPWSARPDYLESNPTPGYHERVYREAMDRLSSFAGKHGTLRMTSAEAVRHIPDGLDFVWVDGDHKYEAVKSDLDLYWPKVKHGGVLCGHDYTNNADTCQVKRAVDEFAAAHGLGLTLFPDVSSCWVIQK